MNTRGSPRELQQLAQTLYDTIQSPLKQTDLKKARSSRCGRHYIIVDAYYK